MKKDLLKLASIVLSLVALVIGSVSLTMNLIQKSFNTGEQTVQSVVYVPTEEKVTVVNLLTAGISDTSDAVSYENVMDAIGNSEFSTYLQKGLVGNEVSLAGAESTVQAGFNLIGLAGPSAYDYGRAGIETSLAYWQQKEVYTSGTYLSTDEANKIAIAQHDDLTVAFLSFTDVLDQPLPDQQSYCVSVYDDYRSTQLVNKAAQAADVVIVQMYWDSEGTMPSERQTEIAQMLSYAGASVIVGQCENVIQPISWIDDTLVFYSLGYLSTDEEGSVGAMGSVTITKTTLADKKRVELTNPKADLITCTAGDVDWLSNVNSDLYNSTIPVITQMDDSIRIGGLQ